MKIFKRYITLILSFLIFISKAQELPPIHNFSSFNYKSGNQNWDISQAQDKLIYIANNEGLLEFNGSSWQLYASPNETIMRSVAVIGDRIYTGSYMDFGFWKRNNFGTLEYTSISETLNLKLFEDEEFWHIVGIENWMVFQSLNRIYIYDKENEKVNVIESDEVINKMFELEETVYFHRLNKGIYKIENGKDLLFLDDPQIKNAEIVNLFKDGNKILILTRNDGFYSLEDENLTKWKTPTFSLDDLSIYNAIELKDKNFAIGTISNGLIYLDKQEGIVHEFNQSNGMQNNTVLSVFEDIDGNIWTGLDNGVSYVNINSPIKVFDDKRGMLGSVYASAILNNNIYLGTNQGLFYKSLKGESKFKFIENTQGQVWCLKVIENTLFCGHDKGTFIIKNGLAKQVSNVKGTWNIKALNGNPDMLIQGNYDGLYILHKPDKKSWKLKNKIKGFNNSSRSFEVLGDDIFVNHEYRGIFHLVANESFTEAEEIYIDTLLKGANSSITKYKGNILYAYEKGVLKYDFDENTFIKDSVLSNIYSEENYTSGRIVPSEKGDKFWIFTKDNITLVSSGNLSKVPKVKSLPLTFDKRRDVIEYENIIDVNDLNQYILGTSFGYLLIDIENILVNDFMVSIGSVSNGINRDHSASGNLIDLNVKGDFANDENNLSINYYAPEFYKYFNPSYQFQLLGIYDVWSDWDTESSVFFENLPPGDYTFNVRAKVGEKISGNMASYKFSISKPWYISDLMIAGYVLFVILFSIFMHNLYRGYYHTQQRKLIQQNKRDLELARVQNEKEIIKIKNEQLKKDFKSKSKELAASTLSIARKNELLIQIKNLLGNIEDKKTLGPVMKIIDKSLSHDENWELFREAFNNADSEFFKILKNQHPDLSPNDLKLCAYLRLNLSSKEIAQLINISPKSVEIKRYRLRKKLHLESHENLTDYILNM